MLIAHADRTVRSAIGRRGARACMWPRDPTKFGRQGSHSPRPNQTLVMVRIGPEMLSKSSLVPHGPGVLCSVVETWKPNRARSAQPEASVTLPASLPACPISFPHPRPGHTVHVSVAGTAGLCCHNSARLCMSNDRTRTRTRTDARQPAFLGGTGGRCNKMSRSRSDTNLCTSFSPDSMIRK